VAYQQDAVSGGEDCDSAKRLTDDFSDLHFSLLSKRRFFAGVSWFPLGRRVAGCLWGGLWRGLPGDDPQQVEVFGEGHSLNLTVVLLNFGWLSYRPN